MGVLRQQEPGSRESFG